MTDAKNRSFLETLRSEFRTLPAGARVPTIREVAAKFSVSQFAVQRTFEALKEEGLIQSFVGRGSFIVGGEATETPERSETQGARILIVSHSMPSARGTDITNALQAALERARHKSISISYSDVSDLHDLLGRGGFDICILQPRRSVLPVGALALLKSKARHMIVEGRQLELIDVDIFLRNRAKSIAIALRHLRGMGHQNIGLLTERLDLAAGYAEIENLYTQLSWAQPGASEGMIVRVAGDGGKAYDAKDIGDAIREEISANDHIPSAFIVSGRFSPDDIERGFADAGLTIPADVSIVHLRASSQPADSKSVFTTVGRTADHVASGIVDIVNWRLANPNEPTGLILDDPTLTEGPSVRALMAQNDGEQIAVPA